MRHEIYRYNPTGDNTLEAVETLPDNPREVHIETIRRLNAKAKLGNMTPREIQEVLEALMDMYMPGETS